MDISDGAFFAHFRASLDAMTTDIGHILADLGLTDYRPRFSTVIRVVTADGPSTIGHITVRMNTTHSAGSQTVAAMTARGLVELRTGSDARQRLVHLTAKAHELLPAIDAEWAATSAAVRDLGRELSAPLDTIAQELTEALRRRSFHDRVAGQLDRPEPDGG